MVELFGFASVVAMVLFYSLEARSPGYVLAFSGSCLSAAAYAAMIGSWPFASVEALWAVIAFRRWLPLRESAPSE
jgi:hypothetical protein